MNYPRPYPRPYPPKNITCTNCHVKYTKTKLKRSGLKTTYHCPHCDAWQPRYDAREH